MERMSEGESVKVLSYHDLERSACGQAHLAAAVDDAEAGAPEGAGTLPHIAKNLNRLLPIPGVDRTGHGLARTF